MKTSETMIPTDNACVPTSKEESLKYVNVHSGQRLFAPKSWTKRGKKCLRWYRHSRLLQLTYAESRRAAELPTLAPGGVDHELFSNRICPMPLPD